jgi:hypothetical protein
MIADREEIKAIRGSLVRKDEGPLGEAGNWDEGILRNDIEVTADVTAL